MTDDQMEIQRLRGELLLLEKERDFFAKAQDKWRSMYLKEHPEQDNWDYVEEVEAELE